MTFALVNTSAVVGLAGLSLDFRGSTLLLLLLILLGLAWSVLAYRQTVPPTRLSLRLFLGSLRALSLLLLILLIFEPSLSLHRERHLKPLLGVIFDDSQSLSLKDASGPRSQGLAKLMRDPAWKTLGSQFDMKVFAAGDSLRLLSGVIFDSLRLNAIGTDLAADWERTLKTQEADTFGALVLVSDGGDNAGKNPLKAAQGLSVPLFTVGVGDTAAVQDASIASVSGGEVAYRGKETQVTARLKTRGLEGRQASLELVGPDGRVLARQDLKLPPDDMEAEATLKFTPQQVGTLPLNLRLSSSSREWSDENNQRSFPLEVRESRIRVLVLSATPGFEAMFFAKAASAISDMEVKSLTFRQDGSMYGAGSEALSKDFVSADVLVLMGLPDQENPSAARERLHRALAEHPLPTWIWAGPHPSFDDLKDAAGEIPLRLGSGGGHGSASALPLRFYAELDPDAELSESGLWNDLPPLDLPEFGIQAGPGTQTLVGLKDNSSGADMGPALISWEGKGKRFAASFGAGYWKWSFLSGGLEGSDDLYRNYLGRVLRWLAASPRTKPLKLSPDRELYSSGEAVRFGAQVLGGEGRFVSSAQVEVTLQGPEGSSKVVLEPDASGHYAGAFHPEAVGTYTFRGLALAGSDTLGSDSGNFMVQAYNIEKETLNQNRALLQAIAKAGGGVYFPADSIAALSTAIKAPPRVITAGWSRRFFLNWDVWGLLVGLLSLEWLIRKRKGML